ncbi:glutathione-disulfide reductase [Lichenibacterium dinghuense]|uniref:glutathione-disulfide reductase n=1 Tax=Lichenibacterium dinghuense TaxID=2895977 RepID=UPI001EFFB3CF|nr:glutathione-disulfide reductase [Lichenibacterium sp. 6Y81]
MSTPDRVDYFVIGAGSGGVRSGRIAASHGAKVMVAEDFRIGGTCVIRGCVPKKLYVYASRFADEFADAAGFGWTLGATRFDWPHLVRAKEAEITRLSGLYRQNLEKAGASFVEARARIDGPNAVVLTDGRRVEAEHILVATGGRPTMHPDIPGLEHAITSNEIFDLREFPRRLVVVGAGYIGLEFASVFARLGAEVTVMFRGDQILSGFDDDMRDGLAEALREAGITLLPRTLPRALTRSDGRIEVLMPDGSTVAADQVLMATGRAPNTRNMGLAEAGVALDRKGAVKVDAFSHSSVPSIHAVGDVTDRVNLTPVAVREGHALADTLFGGRPTSVDHAHVASAVFCTPEIGSIGLTERQARERHDVVDIFKAGFRPLKATVSGRKEKVLFKLVVDGVTDRVLGVHILGPEAGEMIQMCAIAVRMGATKADFDATMAVHPTMAEEIVTMRTRSARHVRAVTTGGGADEAMHEGARARQHTGMAGA